MSSHDELDWLQVGEEYKLKLIKDTKGVVKNNTHLFKVLSISSDRETISIEDKKTGSIYFVNRNHIINPNHPEDKYSNIEITCAKCKK